ncbi:leucine-rich repeat-containing protein 31 isoform X2 [Amia ocellicauda]|uniref:leucine-rich repeat-containing protein 31 isoform X2 n=1 Tax=Amia ocellicauda TaxID=2972642 RepID=UPI00346408FC
METQEFQKRGEGTQRRSPFDLIMNQIRRKKSLTERRQRPSVTRFFRPSEDSEKRGKSSSQTKESENDDTSRADGKENLEPVCSDSAGGEVCSVVGWGRVKMFAQKLGKKPDSRSLSLNHCDLTATDVVELATMLPFLTLLEELDLSWNDLIGGALKALTFHLQHINKLKTLKLSSCRLTAEDLTALGEALDYIPMLEILYLSWNNCIGGNLHTLTHKLEVGCRVKELHLVDCQLTARDAKSLGERLCLLPCLEVLDLSANKLVAGGLEDLTQELKNNCRLRVLRMQMCGLQQDSICTLGNAFPFLSALQQLDLSCNKEAGGGFKQAAAQIGHLSRMQNLDLHLCCLTEEDMEGLNQVAPSLCDLTMLDLSSNKKIGRMCQQLFPSLPLCKMKRIVLNNCNLTKASYQSLGDLMLQLSELETLNLSWNKCVGGSLKLLLDPLQPNPRLQELKLSSCNLTTEDMVHLASVSKSGKLASLRLLDLTYNDTVGDQGWALFFQEVGGLQGLGELDISLRPSSRRDPSPWLDSLLSALHHLPALTDFAMQRWLLSLQDTERLDAFNKESKRNVRFDYCFSTPKPDGEEPVEQWGGSKIIKKRET